MIVLHQVFDHLETATALFAPERTIFYSSLTTFLKIRAYTGLFFFLSSSFSQYDDKYSTKFRLWQLTVISYQHIQVLFCCAETVTAKNWSMNFRKILQLIRTVNVIIALWRKSRFSRFPLKQEYAIPKVINSLRVYFWFK